MMMSPFSKRFTIPFRTSPIRSLVLGVHVLAFGFADLLEDHLLGGLCRDAAEILGRARELDLHVDFGFVAVELLRFGQRDLRGLVGDFVDDPLDRIQLELPGFLVEPRAQRLALVALAGGRLQRVLDGADDDLRIDALFLGDGVDLLQQRIYSGHFLAISSQLPA